MTSVILRCTSVFPCATSRSARKNEFYGDKQVFWSGRQRCESLRRTTTSMALKLTYFPIEAAAEKVRLALVMTDTPFEDVRVPFPEWPALKPTTKYGQMPFLTLDDGTEMFQSFALLKYVAKMYGDDSLYPQDPKKLYEVEETLGLSDDLARAWSPCLYVSFDHTQFGHPADWPGKDDTIKELREKFIEEKLPQYMKFLSDKIEASGSQFLCGENVTIADLVLLPQLRMFILGFADHVPTDCLEKYPVVTSWMSRMMEVPQIKEWYATPK